MCENKIRGTKMVMINAEKMEAIKSICFIALWIISTVVNYLVLLYGWNRLLVPLLGVPGVGIWILIALRLYVGEFLGRKVLTDRNFKDVEHQDLMLKSMSGWLFFSLITWFCIHMAVSCLGY